MKLVELPFGTFEFHDKYIVSRISEGAEIDCEEVELLIQNIKEHYHGKPVGYISRRENAMSLNPMAHIKYPPYEAAGVVAFAIVAYRDATAKIAQVEQQLSHQGGKVKMELFWDFDEAVRWTLEYVERERGAQAV